MKKFVFLFLMVGFLSGVVLAKAKQEPPKELPVQAETLKDQMDKMILSVADLDIMIHKDHELDFDILTEDAQRILLALGKIKELDKDGVYKKHVKNLERPTKMLLAKARQQDIHAADYAEPIFEACFKCHMEHRPDNLTAPTRY